MSSVIYYAATSMDGFIAEPDGGIGWLEPFDHSGEDYGYEAFFSRLGAIIMGSATYLQVLELSPTWMYPNVDAVVMTKRTLPQPKEGNVTFTADDPADVVWRLRESHSRDIWLVGGGKLAAAFAQRDLIDEYDISTMPVVLGAGISLMEDGASSNVRSLRLMEHHIFPSGVIRARYRVIRPDDPE